MQLTYEMTENTFTNNDGTHINIYGIKAVGKIGFKKKILAYIPNIFIDKDNAKEFISLCNTEKLELRHLKNVVDDIDPSLLAKVKTNA